MVSIPFETATVLLCLPAGREGAAVEGEVEVSSESGMGRVQTGPGGLTLG